VLWLVMLRIECLHLETMTILCMEAASAASTDVFTDGNSCAEFSICEPKIAMKCATNDLNTFVCGSFCWSGIKRT
jgi:hypothetical protein